jgi:hypothetical protein
VESEFALGFLLWSHFLRRTGLHFAGSLPKSELESVDNWGCSAGMPNRNAALRTLLRNALKTVVQTGGGTNAAVVRNRKKAR